MNASVVTSTANRTRLDRAGAWLLGRDAAEEVLIVGATLDATNEFARYWAKVRGAAFGWHQFTLAQLAAEISAPALAERGVAPLSRSATEAVIARLVHRLKVDGEAGRYRGIADTPGFPRAIARVIGELRHARVPVGPIAAAAPDLARVIACYDAELAEADLTDWPDVFALAAENAATHRFAGLPLLMLGVSVASQSELVFLRALAAKAPAILATVPAGDEPTLSRLRDALKWPIEDLDRSSAIGVNGGARPATGLGNLQRNLFNERRISPTATSAGADIQVFSAPGEGRECVEISRRVLSLAREGVAFDRIAVLLRAPETYRAHLEEAFERAAIPTHFARGARRPDPAGRAFIALLKCAAENLSARRFAEYLSLGQVPDAAPSGAPPAAVARGDRWVAPDTELVSQPVPDEGQDEAAIDDVAATNGEPSVRDGQLRAPWRWENLLVEAAVIGGRDRWQRRIDGLTNDLQARLAELEDEDETEAAALARTVDDLAGYAMPLIDALAALPGAASWGDWLDQLGAIATRALKRADRVLAVLAELAPLAPVGPVGLGEVLRVISPLLLESAVPAPPQRYGKVFIGPVEASRGLSFQAVFVPGLAERMFPRKIVEDPILLDALRAQISGDLATNQSRVEGERLALALAAGAAENRICFSYPRIELDTAQPRPRVPSFYALEALRASEGQLPDFADLARRAETATTARLGWPAPPDPDDAIDSAEHDLAILDRLATATHPGAGAARYLITANPHLARALRARYQRWGGRWTPADGLLTRSEAARTIMARHSLGVRSYSPTALQHYARCPYRFFLSAVQRLAPRLEPEPIDELDPLQRGSLIHDIQFEVFARLQRGGLLPLRPTTLGIARQQLDAVINEVAARYYDDLAPAIDRVWLDGIAAITADLREWLRRASEDQSGYVPRHFELSFGLNLRGPGRSADPRSVAGAVDLACGIQLRGSIDLVERHPSGRMRVTDHKTGKFYGKDRQLIAGGTTLQPLLYALAAERLFAGEATIESGRLYFCTATGGFASLEVPLDDQARAAAVQVAATIGDAVAGPFLPAAPDKGACAICDFQPVCGPHEERRVTRKPKGSLEPLLALRGAQ